mgnify:CR=1 FL=1
MRERTYYNAMILHKLKVMLNKNPDMRFIQALWILGIADDKDRFYEEPEITYKRIINNLNSI